jgi:hypothetical protein
MRMSAITPRHFGREQTEPLTAALAIAGLARLHQAIGRRSALVALTA